MVDHPPGSIRVGHESGQTTNENFMDYLEHFVKFSYPNSNNPILLLLDNQASYTPLEVLKYYRNNCITMVDFPPRITRVTAT